MANVAPVRREPIVVPECGILGVPLRLSLWLVPRGARVREGERVAEIVTGGATIDLEAPVAGRLVVLLVDEDETVGAGMVVAEIEVLP
jgi:pyruvate/2-oxoglutarate dehydrogenase complex dihydrolipoamide acyltransferase (E2) component